MEKSPDAFRTISEAAEELDLPQHVLRFWETRFSTIKPLKRGGGRRYYRPEDVLLLKGIRYLLYDQGFTIKGVQRILKDQGVRNVIAVGQGHPMDAAVVPQSQDHMAEKANGHAHPMPEPFLEQPRIEAGQHGRALDDTDREKLAFVLRELLDCKRILERARE